MYSKFFNTVPIYYLIDELVFFALSRDVSMIYPKRTNNEKFKAL